MSSPVNSTFLVGETPTEVYARISSMPSPFRVVVVPGMTNKPTEGESKSFSFLTQFAALFSVGNPGNVTVYETFIDEVFRLLGERCSVYGCT